MVLQATRAREGEVNEGWLGVQGSKNRTKCVDVWDGAHAGRVAGGTRVYTAGGQGTLTACHGWPCKNHATTVLQGFDAVGPVVPLSYYSTKGTVRSTSQESRQLDQCQGP